MAGIGAVEKVAAKERAGIVKVTNKVIKHNSTLLEQKGKSFTQIIREVVKDLIETKDFGKTPCATGEKCWLQLNQAELKKIGPVSPRSSDIKDVYGSVQDAFEFFKAQVVSFAPDIKNPTTLVGKNAQGISFSYRATSKSSGNWPTIHITGIPGLRKIKFKN